MPFSLADLHFWPLLTRLGEMQLLVPAALIAMFAGAIFPVLMGAFASQANRCHSPVKTCCKSPGGNEALPH
jgi:hypothetical protein